MKTAVILLCSLVTTVSLIAQEDSLESSHIIKLILADSTEVLGYPNVNEKTVTFRYSNMTIYNMDDYGQGRDQFFYYNEEGEDIRVEIDDIDSVLLADSSKCYRKVEWSNYFWNKVVESDEYILYDEGSLFKILNKKSGKVEKIKLCAHSKPGTLGLTQDTKTFEKRVKPYFSDCQGFISIVESNLTETNYVQTGDFQTSGYRLFKGLANYQCD